VEEGSYHKFMHSLLETEDLKAKLLATGNRELVETSPIDRIWGVGFGEEDAEENREKWGLNQLGKPLRGPEKGSGGGAILQCSVAWRTTWTCPLLLRTDSSV
jgi:hypothetical protein